MALDGVVKIGTELDTRQFLQGLRQLGNLSSRNIGEVQEQFQRLERSTQRFEQSSNNVANSINELSDVMREGIQNMRNLEQETRSAEKGFSSFGDVLSASLITEGLVAIAGGMKEMIDNSMELNGDLSRLRENSKDVGIEISSMEGHFKKLAALTGEADSSVEALSNILQTGFDEQGIAQAVEALSGAIIRFPDTLTIESLADGLQETIAVGKPMGQFAELLDRSGVNAEEFEKKLNMANTSMEKQEFILETLSSVGLNDLAQSYYDTNSAMLTYNEAQVELEMALANFSNALLPLVANGFSEIASYATRLSNAFSTEGISGFANEFVNIVLELLNKFSEIYPSILQFGAKVIENIRNGILNAIPILANVSAEIINTLSSFLSENSKSFSQDAVEFLKQLSAGISQNIGILVEAAINLASSFSQYIIDAIPIFLDAIPVVIENLVQGIIQNAPKLLLGALEIIINLVSGLISNIPKIIAAVPKIIAAIANTISEYDWISLGKSIITLLKDGITSLLSNILQSGQEILEMLKIGLKDLSSAMLEIGRNVVSGIWEGIKSMGSWIKNKVKDFGNFIVGGFKDFFNIHSPSRLMRDKIGLMIGQGIGIGIEKSKDFTKNSMKSVNNAIINEIDKKNAKIEQIEKQARERQEKKEEQEKIKKIKNLYEKLEKAEQEEKQNVLDEISNLESNWAEERLKKQELAEKEILNTQIKTLEQYKDKYQNAIDTIKKDYENAVNEVVQKQENLSNKIADFGQLFEETEQGIVLSNIQDDIDVIDNYGNALERLKNKKISESLLNEIMGMDIKKATNYMNELLNLTDKDFENYNKLWEEKQTKAKKIAEKFYQDQLQTLQDDFSNRLSDELQDVSMIMQDIGKDSIQGWIDGINSKLGSVAEAAKKVAKETITALKTEMGLVFFAAEGISTNNLTNTLSNNNLQQIVRNAIPQFENAVANTLSNITPRLLNTAINTNNNNTYNDGDFILKIGTVNNTGSSSIKNILEEAEFYRKQAAKARGGK